MTLESPLDCKEIQPVHSEADPPWDFFGRNDTKAETPVLWPPHAKSWLTGNDWCWEGLRARGDGDDRGWDGWMASLTRWTWVWVNSGSWWWTGRPGVLRFMGSQRVGHDWVTDLIWTVSRWQVCPIGSWCHCETTSLSLWCPFSPLPIVTCYLRSPRHMCTSLEQGLQEVCSVFSVFKQFIGNSIYYMATLKMQIIKLVFSIFRRTHERLAVISTKLEVEKQQNRSLFNTVSTRPVLEPPCVGNFNNPLVLNGNLTPRANVRFSTSIPRPSNNSMETYLTKVSSIIFSPLGFRFLIWMILVFNLVNFWVVCVTECTLSKSHN